LNVFTYSLVLGSIGFLITTLLGADLTGTYLTPSTSIGFTSFLDLIGTKKSPLTLIALVIG